MKAKARAHSVVDELRKEDLHEVVIVGRAKTERDDKAHDVTVVILTYASLDGVVIQGTGAAYRNPIDVPDILLGYRIARGRAEVSLGMQALDTIFPAFSDEKDRAVFQGVLQVLGYSAWQDVRGRWQKMLSRLESKNTKSPQGLLSESVRSAVRSLFTRVVRGGVGKAQSITTAGG